MLKKYIVTTEHAGPLVGTVAKLLNISKNKAKDLIDQKIVFVNGKKIWMAQSPVLPRDTVEIKQSDQKSTKVKTNDKIKIIYQDSDLIAINKPAGIISVGEKNSAEHLIQQQLKVKIFPLHRLDKDTSGVLIFAKNKEAETLITQMFKTRSLDKTYLALCHGKFPTKLIEINQPIDGKTARTFIKIISKNSKSSYLKINIETGRTHQIRKHLNFVKFPLIGDKSYQLKSDLNEIDLIADRQMLHAFSLSFINPITKKQLNLKADIPNDFKVCVQKLGHNSLS